MSFRVSFRFGLGTPTARLQERHWCGYCWSMEPAASASPISGRESVVPRVGYLIYRVERRLKVRLKTPCAPKE
jgi:hypothetical protein